ncbi:MAG: hypothetical protein A2X52_04695 [Candidatus Rokubacteria bacterium GWC2_70_16]|nr:MAG: hypothetical protein A2X52_04695 [Candidatus Rokubacteria bacterium GWC2_70_16]
MSRRLGYTLPPALRAELSQQDLASRLGLAIPLVTVDEEGRPHPMLLSHLEVLALGPETVRIVIAAGSRSAANLAARGHAALLLIEPAHTFYVKATATEPPLVLGALARFELTVTEVLEDAPAAWEEGLAVTGGITYAPVPALDTPWVRETLAALRAEPGS